MMQVNDRKGWFYALPNQVKVKKTTLLSIETNPPKMDETNGLIITIRSDPHQGGSGRVVVEKEPVSIILTEEEAVEFCNVILSKIYSLKFKLKGGD